MFEYLITYCREDGTTPLGKCPNDIFQAKDYGDLMSQFHARYPEHEVVSWGRKDQIENISNL